MRDHYAPYGITEEERVALHGWASLAFAALSFIAMFGVAAADNEAATGACIAAAIISAVASIVLVVLSPEG